MHNTAKAKDLSATCWTGWTINLAQDAEAVRRSRHERQEGDHPDYHSKPAFLLLAGWATIVK